MEHQRLLRQHLQRPRVDPPGARIVARPREPRVRDPLVLDPQRHHRVGPGERVAQRGHHRAPELLDPGGDQRRRSPHADGGAQLAQAVDVRARHPAVRDVSDDGDLLPLQGPPALAQAERVEQPLGGVLVEAVARVDHARPHRASHQPGSARRGMPDHQRVRADSVEVADGVLQRFALGHAGGILLEAEHVGAQRLGGDLERAARPRAALEEEGDHVPAAQEPAPISGRRLPRARLRALPLESGRQGEQALDLSPRQRLQLQQVPGEVHHQTPCRSRRAKCGESPASRIFRAVFSALYWTRWNSTTLAWSSQMP